MITKELRFPLSQEHCLDNDNPVTLEVLTTYGIIAEHPRPHQLRLGRQALSAEELLDIADARLLEAARQKRDARLAHPALAVTALQLCMEHEEPMIEISSRSVRTDEHWEPRWVALDSPGYFHLTREGVEYDTAVVPTYRTDDVSCLPREFVHFVTPDTPGAGLQTTVHRARPEDGVGPVFFGTTGKETFYPG